MNSKAPCRLFLKVCYTIPQEKFQHFFTIVAPHENVAKHTRNAKRVGYPENGKR